MAKVTECHFHDWVTKDCQFHPSGSCPLALEASCYYYELFYGEVYVAERALANSS